MADCTETDVRAVLTDIERLSRILPSSIAEGCKDDRIYYIFTKVSGEDTWSTFNRRFDLFCGEDCRDKDGHFPLIRRGRDGMDMVCSYLRAVDLHDGMPLDLVRLKLTRLRDDLLNITASAHVLKPSAIQNKIGDQRSTDSTNAARKVTLLLRPTLKDVTSTELMPTGGKRKATDVEPGTAKGKRAKKKDNADAEYDSGKDKDYKPRNRNVSEEPVGCIVLGSDGEEILGTSSDENDDDDAQPKVKRKRVAVLVTSSDDEDRPSPSQINKKISGKKDLTKTKGKTRTSTAKTKKKQSSSGKNKRSMASRARGRLDRNSEDEVVEVSEEENSDGQSALRDATEKKKARDAIRRGPKSQTLEHWGEPVAVKEGMSPRWRFKCKHCGLVRTVARDPECEKFSDETPRPSTANLTSHITRDHPDLKSGKDASTKESQGIHSGTPSHEYSAGSAKIMAAFLEEGKLNPKLEPTQKGFLKLFAAWILDEDLPFTTGEAPGLANLFKYLHLRYQLPSDTTVRNTLAAIFAELHGKVVEEMNRVKSKIAYMHDNWTTKQMVFTFAGTIAGWIDDDWNLVERLIDFHHIKEREHAGQHAAKAFVNSAAKIGGLDKIALTMDNASSCDVLARTLGLLLLERYNIPFHAENNRIRCMAHVVNLIVQSILSELEESDNPDDVDHYFLHKNMPFHFDIDEDEELREMEAEEINDDDLKEDSMDVDDELPENAASLSALKKLRLIVNKIVASPNRRACFKKLAKKNYAGCYTDKNVLICLLMVLRDVITRWNSTHAMTKRALMLRKAINEWVLTHEAFQQLFITAEQWKLLEQLCSLLEIFTQVTLQMSRSNTPTLPWVIPMYEHMRKSLSAAVEDSRLHKSLRRAARAGLVKLEQYYDLARKNQFNVVATVCHPSLRLAYFKKLGGDAYDRAEVLFKHVYETYEKNISKPASDVATESTSSSDMSFLASVAMMEDGQDPYAEVQQKSEFERYAKLGEGGLGVADQPLLWWKAHEREFPIISRIARDYLAIRATSVPVERLFSKSRHVCTDCRSCFKAETISVAMCTKEWIRDGLLDIR